MIFSYTTAADCQELDDERCDLLTTKCSILVVMNSKVIYFNKHIRKQYVMFVPWQDVSASSQSGSFEGVFL